MPYKDALKRKEYHKKYIKYYMRKNWKKYLTKRAMERRKKASSKWRRNNPENLKISGYGDGGKIRNLLTPLGIKQEIRNKKTKGRSEIAYVYDLLVTASKTIGELKNGY